MMTEEEKKTIEELEEFIEDDGIQNISVFTAKKIKNIIDKQQKLINIFISNEAVKEGKDFNEIKEKYYECL